jgi:hypothetical protein
MADYAEPPRQWLGPVWGDPVAKGTGIGEIEADNQVVKATSGQAFKSITPIYADNLSGLFEHIFAIPQLVFTA